MPIRKQGVGVPLALSLLFHMLLLSLFALHFDSHQSPSEPLQPEVMEAVVMDEAQIQAEKKRFEAMHEAEAAARKAELAAQREAEAEAIRRAAEKEEKIRTAAEARQKAEDEAKQQAELEAHREAEAEATRRAADEEVKIHAAAEARQKAEAEAKRQAEQEAHREAEAEAARIAREESKHRAAALAKQKAEAEAKRQAEMEAQAQHELETEEKRMTEKASNSKPDTKTTTEEAARDWISNKIRPKVEKFSANSSGRSCTVRVTMLPGGGVQSVSVTLSSGDESFDRSVQAAVLKASPLPWPDDEKVAEELKTFSLIVKSRAK